MRRFAKVLVADQEVTCMLGYKEIKDIQMAPYDSVEQPFKCPDCPAPGLKYDKKRF